MKNLAYMQLKKTHDAAMVLIQRIYGERPRFNYFFGSSQGGREALTVAQRYPADYDGVAANVPIVSLSSLMLAPELIRIQEKPLANWVPNTDPSGSGLIVPNPYRGQEGAGENAPLHSHLGVLGVTGFLMQNLKANPLDYVEGGAFDARRREISLWLDSTNPDLSASYKRGGKMIVAIGTNDTLASPGAQLDYYQSVIKKMGRKKINSFTRVFVLPQTGHGLSGTNYSVDGEGKSIPAAPIPSAFSRFSLLVDWVEKKVAPPISVTVTGGNRSLPMCTYPSYPKYVQGPADAASSYVCAER